MKRFSVRNVRITFLASETRVSEIMKNVLICPKTRPELSVMVHEQKANASEMCVCLKDTHSDASMFRTAWLVLI
jgi:hypothetical protein